MLLKIWTRSSSSRFEITLLFKYIISGNIKEKMGAGAFANLLRHRCPDLRRRGVIKPSAASTNVSQYEAILPSSDILWD